MKRLLGWILWIACSTLIGHAQSSFNSPETGIKPLGTYFATEVDTVSLSNGNLNVNIPLFTLPGRELPVRVAMDYNHQFIEPRIVNDPELGQITYYDFYGWRKDTNIAGKLSASKVQDGAAYYENNQWWAKFDITITWVDSRGAKHKFEKQDVVVSCGSGSGPCGNNTDYDNRTIDTTESQFFQLKTGNHFSSSNPTQPAILYFKDGSQLNISTRTFRTLNGNYLTGAANTETSNCQGTAMGDFVPVSDTLGRTISVSAGTTQTITLSDSNGQAQIYRITFAAVSANFGGGNPNSTFCVVQTIELPNARQYQFLYNAKGMLQKITFPSGAYIRYTYLAAFAPYERVGTRVVSVDGTAGSEKTTTYEYSPITRVTDPLGNQQVQYFSGVLAGTTEFLSNSGAVLKKTERVWNTGNNSRLTTERTILGGMVSEKRYSYDGYNNVTQEDHHDFGLGSAGARTRYITRTYLGGDYVTDHIYNRVTEECIKQNSGTSVACQQFVYDDYTAQPLVSRSGTIPGWTAPATTRRGNATAVKQWHQPSGTYFTTGQQYDVLGNVVKVTDPGGHATDADFTDHFMTPSFVEQNPANPTFAYPTRATSPNGFYVDTRYDYNTGLVRRTIDSLNRTTSMTYDILNRETQTTHPNGGWTTHTYDDTTPKTTREVLVDGSGNVGRVITTFDKMYRVIKTETADPAGNIFVDAQYDGKGRKWKVSNPYRTGDTIVWTEFQYDGLDRPSTTIAPDGSTVQYGYKHNQTTVTDEAGNPRRYTYDGFGRMTKVEEPNPSLLTPLVTTYSYNELDKLTQTAQGSQTRTFVYDSLGRMTSQTLPESGTTLS